MSDDGSGIGIRIPSMLVNKVDGEKLIKFLTESDQYTQQKTTLLAEFLLDVREDNKVDVQFWYTSSDDKSLDLLMGMKDLLEDIFGNI